MRALGVAWLATALACGEPGSEPGGQRLEGYRSKSPSHKVQLDAQKAAELVTRGAKVLGDYGSFKLVQVDDATLDSLSPEQGAELRDDYDHILLNAGLIDTASEYAQALRGMNKKMAVGEKAFHLVHFTGPVRPEWLEELKATGVRVVTYVPNNAYLVYGDAAALGGLQKHIATAKAIQWDGQYLNDYKLDPTVQTAVTPTYAIQLVKDEQTNDATLALIRKLQSREAVIQEALGYVNVVATVDRQAIYEIVQRPDVLSIQPRPEPRKFDERQNMIIAGQITGTAPTGPGYMAWLASKGFTQEQFSASGFGVDVSDSGLDNGTQAPNHFGLYLNGDVTGTSRVVYNRLEGTANSGSTISGCDGHGTLNTHIIGGFTSQTGAPHTDAAGFHYGMGVAPFVKVGSSVVFDPGTFTSPNYANLQSRAYRDGMRISSNSWGSRANTYTVDAQQFDALVRDAQPSGSAVESPGNQEMIIVFAAGNSGSAANTVGSPSTGKNIFTVGASENVQAFGGADGCDTTDAEANSAYDMATFSGRGPTSDGRKKPDIVAPGTHVSGGVSQSVGQRANPPEVPTGSALSCFDGTGVCGGTSGSFYFPSTQQWFSASSGTSHSTPAVAGGTALVRQYFINQGVTPPSPAMTKAYLMNSARYMTGTGANDSLYSNSQGMGLMDLGMAFDLTPRLLDDQNLASLLTETGQTRTFKGMVEDVAKPFRVTLAWTDAPGSTTGSAWKNNLDLTVSVGGNTYKGNVFTGPKSVTGGTADSANNVESVFLPAGVSGTYTVTVSATNINSDGVPNNSTPLDQDFALVAYNSCLRAAATPSGTTATVSGSDRIEINWTPNGSASYNIYRATKSGGPYTQVGSAVAPPFADVGVPGGATFYYMVRAIECVESPDSNEASVVAPGVCGLPPTFDGLTSVNNGAASTCATTLAWSPASSVCAGSLSYSVYRSTTPGFTPSEANRIATGVTGTSFADDQNLTSGSPYYYIVRATETSSDTLEERNKVQKTATPTGAISPGVFFDDFDANRPAAASAYWTPTAITGNAATMAIVSGCHYQSATNAYRMGATATTCGGTYLASQSHLLMLGGSGAVSSSVNGLTIPAGAANPQMTFNVWYDFESKYDGVWLVYSTTGASGPWINVGDEASSTVPYISAGGYDNVLSSSTTTRIWTATNNPANGALKAVTVNLSTLSGKKVWFGFRFYTDTSGNQEGFYVDDVRLPAEVASSCTTHVPPAGPAVAYTVTALPAAAQVGKPVSFNLTAIDTVGQVATGYSGTASFTSSDGAAILPAPATFTAGVANGLAVTFNTGGTQSITATDAAAPSITGSSSTSVTTATKLVFGTQPVNALAGASLGTVRVNLTDKDGSVVTTGSYPITLSLANNPGSGTLAGTLTATTVSGVATFTGLSINKVGTGYTLKATSQGGIFTETTSAAFNITSAAASRVSFVTQPSTTVAGTAITPAVQVAIQDQYGNPTTSTATVTLTLTSTAGGTLSGTTTAAAVNGVATFANLSIEKAGADYTLKAASGTLTTANSNVFAVTSGAPYRMTITRQPSNVQAGATLTPSVQVSLYDRFGNLSTQATQPVSLLLGTNPTGASLNGVTTVNAVAGVATFDSLSVSRSGSHYTLVASSNGLFQDTSISFDVNEGLAEKLVFRAPPANAAAGTVLEPVFVELQDGQGHINTSSTAQVTLSLGGTTDGVLGGTTTVTAVNGVAKFEGLSLRKAGSGYSLVASAQGYESATSAAFEVTSGPAASFTLVFPASVTAGQEVSLSATASDAYGNVARSYAGPVNVTSSDTAAVLPATASFVEGVLSGLKVTFKTTGLRTLTLTDAAQGNLSGVAQTNVTPFAQPTVAVTSPAAGTEVSGEVSITATAAVAEGTTISQLAILVDGVVVGSGTDATLAATWDSSQAANGSAHIITAVITDSAGNVVSSAPVGITVKSANGDNGDPSCGCGATSGTDASLYLGLFALARYVSMRRRQTKKAA